MNEVALTGFTDHTFFNSIRLSQVINQGFGWGHFTPFDVQAMDDATISEILVLLTGRAMIDQANQRMKEIKSEWLQSHPTYRKRLNALPRNP